MGIISKLKPLVRPRTVLHQSKRKAGGGHGMLVPDPSIWAEMIGYDRIHFWTVIGFAPVLLFGTYMSVFVGDAILQDTPKGYVPEDWECERNPICRLLARYFLPDSVFEHEYKLGLIARENDSRMVKLAIEEVKKVQQQHRDYQAWFFQPTTEAVTQRRDRYHAEKTEHYANPPTGSPGY